MNIKTLTVLNDKLQAAIQAENFELVDIALDQMKDEVASLRVRARTKAWMREHFDPLTRSLSAVGTSQE